MPLCVQCLSGKDLVSSPSLRKQALELSQIGTGDRDVVAIAEAAKEGERLQFFLLVSLRRTIGGYVNIKISDAETHHGALHAATGRDPGDVVAAFARPQSPPLQKRFHIRSVEKIVGILDDDRFMRLRLEVVDELSAPGSFHFADDVFEK